MAKSVKYRNILFDWDGCLAQTLDAWIDAYSEAFTSFDLQPTRTEVTSVIGHVYGPIALGIPENSITDYNKMAYTNANKYLPFVKPYEQAIEILSALHNHNRHLAIVTTSSHVNLENAIHNLGAANYFKTFVAFEDVDNHKPHPDSLLLAMQNLSAKPEETIMIGDTDRDVKAAHSAGVDSILIFHPEHAEIYDRGAFEQSNPTYVCESFAEVAKILDIIL